MKVFNKKLNKYEDITLHFHNDFLTFIEVKNPEKFHKTYDYNKLQIGELRTKQIYIENQDKKITLEKYWILRGCPFLVQLSALIIPEPVPAPGLMEALK